MIVQILVVMTAMMTYLVLLLRLDIAAKDLIEQSHINI
jgi:hypothetical protein